MATWGSTPCHLDDVDDEEDYNLETGADEEEEQEECAESSSDEDVHIYASSRIQRSYSNRNNQGRSEPKEKLCPTTAFFLVLLRNQALKITALHMLSAT